MTINVFKYLFHRKDHELFFTAILQVGTLQQNVLLSTALCKTHMIGWFKQNLRTSDDRWIARSFLQPSMQPVAATKATCTRSMQQVDVAVATMIKLLIHSRKAKIRLQYTDKNAFLQQNLLNVIPAIWWWCLQTHPLLKLDCVNILAKAQTHTHTYTYNNLTGCKIRRF